MACKDKESRIMMIEQATLAYLPKFNHIKRNILFQKTCNVGRKFFFSGLFSEDVLASTSAL